MEYQSFKAAAIAPNQAPRYEVISVDQQRGVFANVRNTTNVKTLDVIALGLVRQRELWVDGERGRKVACESPDAEHGYAKAQYFPYEDAGFNTFDYPGPPSNETVDLKCDECEMRKWQDKPGAGRKPPPCTLSWVLPVLLCHMPITSGVDLLGLSTTPEELHKDVRLLNVKYSSQRNLEKYLIPFRDAKNPTYTVRTRVGISRREKDGRKFADMSFTQLDQVHHEAYPYLSGALRTVREFLLEPPPEATQGAFRPISMGGTQP